MFFIFSKVLFFLIQPVNWMVIPLLYALFGKNKKWKKRALIISVTASLFFTNHFIFNQCIRLWEVNTILATDIKEPYDVGILLGGYSNFFTIVDQDRYNFNERGARFMNTYELYKRGKFKKWLLTGGSGFMYGTEKSEAIQARDFLIRLGVPSHDIIIEPDSKNTRENATLTKKILDKNFPNASLLLITSAWHMRRSTACFDKVGIKYTPFSVDFISEHPRIVPASVIIPNSETIWRWEIFIKEMVGTIAYKMAGYI